MVEFVLIRLAEIRDDAAQEEWEKAHPRRASLRRSLRWLRIKGKLVCKWAAATPPAVQCRRAAVLVHVWLNAQYSSFILASTRRFGLPLPRSVAEQLSVKALLLELELRGGNPASCLERCDLIDAMCGPPPSLQPLPPRSCSQSPEDSCKDGNV